MRSIRSSSARHKLAEASGAVCVIIGVAQMSPALAWIVGGVALVAGSVLSLPKPKGQQQ